MSNVNAGNINLGVRVDTSNFSRQMSNMNSQAQSLGNVMKSLGKKIVAAFAIKTVVANMKEWIDLGAEQILQETKLQTVMQQRMKATDEQVQKMKEYISTQQQLGVIGDEVQLSGAQQLATFLNTDKALQQLIPAMNNLATQQYGYNVSAESMRNIGNLLGKAMQGQVGALTRVGITMSEAEKNAMKYGNEQQRAAILAQIITNNVGNMNQALANTPYGAIQQLKNNFGDFKEILGQLLLNVIYPVIKGLNAIVLAAIKVASAIRGVLKKFGLIKDVAMPAISATNSETSDLSATTKDLSSNLGTVGNTAEKATKKASKGTDKVSKAIKKAKKEVKGLIGSLDAINNISITESAGSSGGDATNNIDGDTGTGTGTGADTGIDLGNIGDLSGLNNSIEETGNKLNGLPPIINNVISKLNDMKNLFEAGFADAFSVNVGAIQGHCQNILKSIEGIFNNPSVNAYANDFFNSFSYNLGRVAGSIGTVGGAIAENLFGGIDSYLSENSGRIQQQIIRMFSIGSEVSTLIGNYSQAFGEVFSAIFTSDSAKGITGDILGIFEEIKVQIPLIFATVGKDVLKILTEPFTNNKDNFIQSFLSMLPGIKDITGAIEKFVQDMFDCIWDTYDTYISDGVQNISDGISELIETATVIMQDFIAPFLDGFGKWFKDEAMPVLTDICQDVIQGLGMIFNGLTEIFKGLCDIILGIFTGDKDKLQEGLCNIFNGIIDALVGLLKAFGCDTPKEVIDDMKEGFKTWLGGVTQVFTGWMKIFEGIFNDDFGKIWDGLVDIVSGVWDEIVGLLKIAGIDLPTADEIKKKLGEFWKKCTEAWEKITTGLKMEVEDFKKKVEEKFNTAKKWVEDRAIEAKSQAEEFKAKVEEKFNTAKKWVEDRAVEAKTASEGFYTKVKEKWDSAKAWLVKKSLQAKTASESIYTKVKEKWDSAKVWLEKKSLKAKTEVGNVFTKIKDMWNDAKDWLKNKALNIKFGISNVTQMAKSVVNKLIDLINSNVINKVRNINILGQKPFSFIKTIPKLADGGFVKRNTPQLAVIGDNRRYGEIVAPEDKMNEMVNNALKGYSNMMQSQKAETYTGDIIINLDGKTIYREEIIKVLRSLKRQGVRV